MRNLTHTESPADRVADQRAVGIAIALECRPGLDRVDFTQGPCGRRADDGFFTGSSSRAASAGTASGRRRVPSTSAALRTDPARWRAQARCATRDFAIRARHG